MVYAPIWIYKVKYVILSDFIRLLFHTFLVVYRAHVRAFDCLLIYSYVLMLTTRRFVVGLCASVLRVPTNKFHSTIQLDKFVTCFWQNNETRKNGLNIMGQTKHAHSLYAHIQCHIKKGKEEVYHVCIHSTPTATLAYECVYVYGCYVHMEGYTLVSITKTVRLFTAYSATSIPSAS